MSMDGWWMVHTMVLQHLLVSEPGKLAAGSSAQQLANG